MDIEISEPRKPSNPYLDRIKVVVGDITKQDTDAIVTLIPQTLEYRGSLNLSILQAAGEKLDEFVLEHIYLPRPGDIYALPGFNMPCRHIFYCVVPLWRDNFDRNDRQIMNACRRAMDMAQEMNLKTISFPALGMNKRGFPPPRAARLILQGIADRLDQKFQEVRIVCLAEETALVFSDRLDNISKHNP